MFQCGGLSADHFGADSEKQILGQNLRKYYRKLFISFGMYFHERSFFILRL